MSKVGAKKSLFKKPAWASTSTKNTDNDEPIFGQTHLYQDIIQAEKLKRERHIARQKERVEQAKREDDDRETKKRRIPKEHEDSEPESGSDARSTRSYRSGSRRSQQSVTPVREAEIQRTTSTPQRKNDRFVNRKDTTQSPRTRLRTTRATTRNSIIAIDDEDDDRDTVPFSEGQELRLEESNASKPLQAVSLLESDSDSEEEDDYLRALKLEARQEVQRIKNSSTEAANEGIPHSNASHHLPPAAVFADTAQASPTKSSERFGPLSRAASIPGEDDTEVKIWIKTIIPGARELIVNRKVSQPLDKVREFWIKRNELDPVIAAKVFFIWNGTRLYNSSTMRGLIERLKRTHPTKDGSDPSNGHITIEAVTDEIFEYRQKQRARALAEEQDQQNTDRLLPNGDALDGPEGTAPAAAAQDNHNSTATTFTGGNMEDDASTSKANSLTPAVKPGIVIKLKAQGLDEISLRVRSNTTMRKILAGFCKLKSVDDNKTQSWLSYDGDKLDPESTVEEAGFEQDDTVEVYLR